MKDKKISIYGSVECHPGDESDDAYSLADDIADLIADKILLEDESFLYQLMRSFMNITDPDAFRFKNKFEQKMDSIIETLRAIARIVVNRYQSDVCTFGLWQPLIRFIARQISQHRGHLEILAEDDSFFSQLLGLEHKLDITMGVQQ